MPKEMLNRKINLGLDTSYRRKAKNYKEAIHKYVDEVMMKLDELERSI